MTRALLLASPFALLIALKLVFAFVLQDLGSDGSYYRDVASHVRDGEGLRTCVSLFHQAFDVLPHPSPVYPLWPVVWGLVARAVPLDAAGVGLATSLWGIALAFAWAWGRRLSPGPLSARVPWLDAGHALALALAVNAGFFRYTTAPYTEGLGFALLFAGLWFLHPRWKDPGLLDGHLTGAWLGLLVLVRGQLVIVALAVAAAHAVALVAHPGRLRRLQSIAACAVAFLATLAPQLLRMPGITDAAPFTALVRFELAGRHGVLSPMHILADTNGFAGHLRNFLEGLPVAFAPTGRLSYARAFHGFQYALPLALCVLAIDTLRDGTAGLRARLRAALEPAALFPAMLAAAGFLSIHLLRKDFTTEWHFGRRHGLTSLFAFFLAWVFLARHRRGSVRRAAFALLGLTVIVGHLQAIRVVAHEATAREPRVYEGLARFLEEAERGHVAMQGHHVQRMAARTRGIGYHWVYAKTTADDVHALAGLGVRWFVIDAEHADAPALRDALLGGAPSATPRVEIDGFEVWAIGPDGGADPAPPRPDGRAGL